MTLIADLAATNDIATRVAGALERVLGEDVILAVGLPRQEPPSAEVLPPEPMRCIVAPFVEGTGGGLVLFVAEDLARTLTSDGTADLASAVADALDAGAAEVAQTAGGGVSAGAPSETDARTLLAAPFDGELLLYPLLDGAERVGCLVVNIAPEGTPAPGTAGATVVDIGAPTDVAVHEFQSLAAGSGGLVDARPLSLLADVEMGVTAELGRRRMTVRELLSLTPGSVIELDRAAGTPVDVLVNGTLIARGEVVVIDEEFGIRVSEIVDAAAGVR